MIKLYSGDLSPYSARVRMQIYANGIADIEIVRPATFGTLQFRQDFPIGRIPLLDIDGDVLPESDVIAEYLEDVYPEPSMLGSTPRETARIRIIARVADIYIMNNMFMLSPQGRAESKNQGIVDLLGGQVKRHIKALNRMIATDGFACFGRLTLEDCALVPALFLVENVLPSLGLDNPLQTNANVMTYWHAIQQNQYAAKTLAELQRGLDERREQIRSGAFQKTMAAFAAAQAQADAEG